MKKISILSLIISILSLTNCSNPEKEEQKFVFKTLFEGIENSRPEILTKKEINLDDSKENEKIFIIRNIQEEVLAIFTKTEKGLELTKKMIFSMPHYGPFSYAIKNKKWEPSKILNPNESYIIQNVQFYQLPGDNFYSIFLEILSEEPPLPLFSVPIVLRKGEKILDGLVEFKEKDFLKENLKTDFIFDETSGKLNIVSPKGEVEMSFDFIEGNFQPSQVTRN